MDDEIHTMVLSHHSELIIFGKTNVSSFSCNYQVDNDADSIQFIVVNEGKETDFIDAHLNLAVKSFDCGSHLITNDFEELLQEPKFPMVKIKFIDFKLEPENIYEKSDKKLIGHFDIELEIAGIMRKSQVPVLSETIEAEDIYFIGEQIIDIRDFGLEAPEKFMGMVKVEDEIMIELKLAFIRVQ